MQLDALKRAVPAESEPAAPGLEQALARAARRLRVGRAIELGAAAAAVGAGVSLLAGAAHALGAPLPDRWPWPWLVLAGPPLAGALLGAVAGGLRPVARRTAAGVLEARLGRGALLSTALELDPAAPFAPLVLREVETALTGLALRRAVPLPRPRALLRALLYAGIGAGLWAIPPWRAAPRVETREVSALAPEQLEAIRRLESRLSREGSERPEVRALTEAAQELARLSSSLEQGGMREIEALARLGGAVDGLRRERERIEARREVRDRLSATRGLEGVLDGRGADAARQLAQDPEARADARQALLRAAESAASSDPELAEALRKAAAGLAPERTPEEVATATRELEQRLSQLPQAYADELVEDKVTRSIEDLEQLRRTITGEAPAAPREPEVAEAGKEPPQGETGETATPPQGETSETATPPQGETGETPPPPQGETGETPPQPQGETGEMPPQPQGESQPGEEGPDAKPPEPGQGQPEGEGGEGETGLLQGAAESMIKWMDEETIAKLMETFAQRDAPPPTPETMREVLEKLEQIDPEVLQKLARAAQQAELQKPDAQPGQPPAPPPNPGELRQAAVKALARLGPELSEELKKMAMKQAEAGQGGTPRPGPKQGPQPGGGEPPPGGQPDRGREGEASGQRSQPELGARAGKLDDPALRAAAEEAIATGRAATPETLAALEKADPELARALSRARAPEAGQGGTGGTGAQGRPATPGQGGRRPAPSGRPIWTPGEGPTESLGGTPREEGAVEVTEEEGEEHARGSIEVPFERVPERWVEEAHKAVQRQQVPEAYERVVREYFGRLREQAAPPR